MAFPADHAAPAAPNDGAVLAALDRVDAAIEDLLSEFDAAGLSGAVRLQALDRLGRQVNRLQAGVVMVVQDIEVAGDWHGRGARDLPGFVKSRLLLEGTGWRYAKVARWADRVPEVFKAFRRGDANLEQVYECVQRLADIPVSPPPDGSYDEVKLADVWAAVDAFMAARLTERKLFAADYKTCADHIVAALDADRHQHGKDRSREHDGLSASRLGDRLIINGTVEAVAGEPIDKALKATTAWQRTGPDDKRSPKRRRLDALLEICRHYLDCDQTPNRRAARYHLVAYANLGTLAALPGDPLDLRPLSASLLAPAAHLADGTTFGHQDVLAMLTDPNGVDITRVLTGPAGTVGPAWTGASWPGRPGNSTRPPGSSVGDAPPGDPPGDPPGTDSTRRLTAALHALIGRLPPYLGAPSEVLDVGRKKRFHTDPMRIAMVVRDGARCVVPGCNVPVEYLQAHHVRGWKNGGTTNVYDGGLACGPHNRQVEDGAILYRRPDGTWHFESPPSEAAAA